MYGYFSRTEKPIVAATHSILMSGSFALCDHLVWIWCSIAGVMGSLTLVAIGVLCECTLLIPIWISLNRGSEEYSLGSGRPRVICMCLIPAK